MGTILTYPQNSSPLLFGQRAKTLINLADLTPSNCAFWQLQTWKQSQLINLQGAVLFFPFRSPSLSLSPSLFPSGDAIFFLTFPTITFSYNVFYFFFFFNVDHLQSLYWTCYNIASVLCFGVLAWGMCHLRDWTSTPCPGRQSLNHWTTKGSPCSVFFLFFCVFKTSAKLTMNLVRKSISKMSLFKNLLHCLYLNSPMKTSIQNNSHKNETERAHPAEVLPPAWLCCKTNPSLPLPHFILIVS